MRNRQVMPSEKLLPARPLVPQAVREALPVTEAARVLNGDTTSAWVLAGAPLLLVLCATLLWWLSLPSVDLRSITDVGLVSVLPPAFFVALGILNISFCLAVHQRRAYVPILLLHVVALIVIIHATPALLYEAPRYSWLYKHIGVVEYIQRHGTVELQRRILLDPNMYIFFSWPGFFAANALVSKIASFENALSYAGWAPPFFNLIYLGALLLIFNTFTRDRRWIWLSVWFFYVTSWIGQDYFAPQALNYFFHLVILGICLKWFRRTPPPSESQLRRWLIFARLASLFRSAVSYDESDEERDPASRPIQRIVLAAIILLLFSVIVSSHQLTPFMTITSISLLVVFQRCRARGLPILMCIVLTVWLSYVATSYMESKLDSLIRSVFQPSGNMSENMRTDLSAASSGRVFVAVASRALTFGVWGLALLGCIRRWQWRYWDLSCILLAVAPFLMVMVQSYGGEVVLRAYFFSLPFMVPLAAALLYPSPASGTSWRTASMSVLLSGGLLTCLLFAYYGNERVNYFTRDEVDAVQYVYRTAPRGSLVLRGSYNTPEFFENYEYYVHISIAARKDLKGLDIETIAQLMADDDFPAAYLIITRGQKEQVSMFRDMPDGALDNLEQALKQSKRFKVVFARDDAMVFSLANAPERSGQ